MADLTTQAAEAIFAILNADATIRTLCGRTTECAIAWDTHDLAVDPRPVLCVADQGTGDSFLEAGTRIGFLIGAFADGELADEVCGNLLDAVEAAITTPALMSHGLANACVDPTAQPFPRDTVPVDDAGIPRLVQRTLALAVIL